MGGWGVWVAGCLVSVNFEEWLKPINNMDIIYVKHFMNLFECVGNCRKCYQHNFHRI